MSPSLPHLPYLLKYLLGADADDGGAAVAVSIIIIMRQSYGGTIFYTPKIVNCKFNLHANLNFANCQLPIPKFVNSLRSWVQMVRAGTEEWAAALVAAAAMAAMVDADPGEAVAAALALGSLHIQSHRR